MKKAWSIILTSGLALIAMGGICAVLALFLDADLVRISDVVFSRYDLTQTILNIQELMLRIKIF